jgi:hypothetical protein
MANVPHTYLSPKQKKHFGIFHAVIWSAFLLLGIYVVFVQKEWVYLFLLPVCCFQVYHVGIGSYKDGKREQAKEQKNGHT